MYTLLEGGQDILIDPPSPLPLTEWETPVETLSSPNLVIIIEVSTSLADPGRGAGTHAPYRCIFFHAVFRIILPNNKSFHSKFSSWRPSFLLRLLNPGSATCYMILRNTKNWTGNVACFHQFWVFHHLPPPNLFPSSLQLQIRLRFCGPIFTSRCLIDPGTVVSVFCALMWVVNGGKVNSGNVNGGRISGRKVHVFWSSNILCRFWGEFDVKQRIQEFLYILLWRHSPPGYLIAHPWFLRRAGEEPNPEGYFGHFFIKTALNQVRIQGGGPDGGPPWP